MASVRERGIKGIQRKKPSRSLDKSLGVNMTAFDKAWGIVKNDEDEEPCLGCRKMIDKDNGIYMGRTFDSQKGPFCSMDCWSGSKYFFDRHDPPHDWER